MTRRGSLAAAATCVLLAGSSERAAHAQATPEPGALSPGRDCAEATRTIAATLDRDARRTRVWYWSWMAAGTALLVGQAALATLVEGDARVEYVVGAGTSVFIPGVLLLHSPRVLADAPLLDARLADTTVEGTLGDPCIALRRAREILRRDADDQALSTSWFAHVFVVGSNVAIGLLLGVGRHDWWGAAQQAVGGSAVGELQILTLPGGALRARGLGVEGSF
jgi:hypothetical protein